MCRDYKKADKDKAKREDVRVKYAHEIKGLVNNSWKEQPITVDMAIDLVMKRLEGEKK